MNRATDSEPRPATALKYQSQRRKLALGTLLLCAAAPQISLGADIFVPDTGNGYSNGAALVSAINTANASAGPDTIILDAGVHYVLDHADNKSAAVGMNGLPIITSMITIRGGLLPPANVTTIRRDTAMENFRIMTVGATGNLRLELVQISDGRAIDSTPPFGGGIYNNGGRVHLYRSQVSNNYADRGGGIFNANQTAISAFGVTTIEETTIEDNRAYNSGGGISNLGRLVIDRSTISGNMGDEFGGAVATGAPAGLGLEMINSTVSGNGNLGIRPFKSGGIDVSFGDASISSSTITENQGLGISTSFSGGTSVTLANTILANNVTRNSSGVVGPADCSGSISSLGANLVGIANSGSGCTLTLNTTDRVGSPAAPFDAQLEPLADNGSYTLTHLPMTASEALGHGLTSHDGCPTVDQRGISRPIYPDRCDIGSVQTSVPFCSMNPAFCNFNVAVLICARNINLCRQLILPRIEKLIPEFPKLDLPVPDCIIDGPGCFTPPYGYEPKYPMDLKRK